MTSFSAYVQKQAMVSGELPMVHTTEFFRLSSIQSSKSLQPRYCKVFKEPLLYFFYGRPAYRDTSQMIPTRDVGFYPICLVFRPGTLCKKAKRIYPFDTGASQSGLYVPDISPPEALADYELQPAVESAKKIIGGFFETDEQYMSHSARPGLGFSSVEGKPESYYRLIRGGGQPDCDDRCSAVEIQIAETIDIGKDVLEAVALPLCFLEDKTLAKTIVEDWEAQPLTYDADLGMRPLEYHGAIRKLIRDYYRQSGLL
jgi:hypothetical protein